MMAKNAADTTMARTGLLPFLTSPRSTSPRHSHSSSIDANTATDSRLSQKLPPTAASMAAFNSSDISGNALFITSMTNEAAKTSSTTRG